MTAQSAVQQKSGYREIAHTADWELEVWAEDLPGLLETAARGMYQLAGVKISGTDNVKEMLELDVPDRESLLIGFLNQLILLGDTQRAAFDRFVFFLEGEPKIIQLSGGRISQVEKEIKAATYHRLFISETAEGLRAHIVFDV